jgi:hypothetical protein
VGDSREIAPSATDGVCLPHRVLQLVNQIAESRPSILKPGMVAAHLSTTAPQHTMRFFSLALLTAVIGLVAAVPQQSCPCKTGRDLVKRPSAPGCCFGGGD